MCSRTSDAIEQVLGELLDGRESRQADVERVRAAASDELVVLPHPLLEAAVLERWRDAIVALRRLAEPLPWFVEAALDETLTRFEAWLEVADENRRTRALLLERIGKAMQEDDEEQLERILERARSAESAAPGRPPDFDLLDAPALRSMSNFWLRRLRFDENARLPRAARATPWSYYGPLLLAVLGAPTATVQTNYLWTPFIGDPNQGPADEPDLLRYSLMNVLFLGVCLYGLWGDLRRRLRGLAPLRIAKRAAPPLAWLFAVNYTLSLLLYWLVAEQKHLDLLVTTFLWGTLSLYLGLFLGLLAQGARIDREELSEG
jgi:hypothetical protein